MFKIGVIGPGGAGKSRLVERWTRQPFHPHTPTIGVDYARDGRFVFWDTGDFHTYEHIIHPYISCADVCVFVHDSRTPPEQTSQLCDHIAQRLSPHTSLVVVATHAHGVGSYVDPEEVGGVHQNVPLWFEPLAQRARTTLFAPIDLDHGSIGAATDIKFAIFDLARKQCATPRDGDDARPDGVAPIASVTASTPPSEPLLEGRGAGAVRRCLYGCFSFFC